MQIKYNGKPTALVTVNLDGERFWLGMFPDAIRRPKTLSMGDYGIARGLDRVLCALKDYEIPATFFVPGTIAEDHPDALEKILRAGHEVASHGHTHIPMHLLSLDAQLMELQKSAEAIRAFTGTAPIGFRAPEGELSFDTLKLAAQSGYRYSSSLYDDDRPYAHDGIELMEIPMNWNTHDFPYFAFNYGPAFPIAQSRVSSYKRVEENYIEEFEAYRAGGLCYVPQFTPQSIGSPGKIGILRNTLKAIREAGDVECLTCGEMLARCTSID